jgi:hypothetical protein
MQFENADKGTLSTQSNNDIRLEYNLWSEGGVVGFVVHNLTDRDIFINMGQSFYISNGRAMNYYTGNEYTDYSFSSVSNALSYKPTVYSYIATPFNAYVKDKATIKSTKMEGESVTAKEEEYVCIPPKSYKLISRYCVDIPRLATCDNKTERPRKEAELAKYGKDDTPMKITNRISYSFDKKEIADKKFVSEFWLKGIKNYNEKTAKKTVSESGCYRSFETKRVFVISAPNKFYQWYNR